MAKDFKLTDPGHDLEIGSNFDFELVEEGDFTKQNLKIILLFFLGEFFLDTTVGIPYFTEILIKNPNIADVDSIFIAAILTGDSVNSLKRYEATFDISTRIYTIVFTVNTTFGLITQTIPIEV